MKVFVTVGFEKRPFDRLIMAIENGIEERMLPSDTFIQLGHSQYLPKACPYQRFLGFEEMERFVKSADIIISHAGVGTILLCFSHNKIPILFPRDSKLGEHVDEHQLDFCRTMEEQKRVLAAYNSKDLFEAIRNYDFLSKSVNHVTKNSNSLNSYLEKILSCPTTQKTTQS